MTPESSIDDREPTMSLREMIETDDDPDFNEDGEFVLEKTSLRTGVAGNVAADPETEPYADPNATRWVFNPFEIIDVRNEPAGCGMLYIRNVVFNRVRSIDINLRKDLKEAGSSPLDQSHKPSSYSKFTRTAHMIAQEFENKHGYKGVVTIHELTGMEAEADEMNTLLFGDQVECVKDFNSPDFPCPVLPNLLETMQRNLGVMAANASMADEDKQIVQAVARRIRGAIRLAMQNARDRIEEGQKRLLDDKSPNRFLSHAEQRSYLALGLSVPTWQPTARGLQQSQMQSNGDLATAVAAGVEKVMERFAGQPQVQVQGPIDLIPAAELDRIAPPLPKKAPPEKVTVPTGKAKKEEQEQS
jgi:hypothetical protein